MRNVKPIFIIVIPHLSHELSIIADSVCVLLHRNSALQSWFPVTAGRWASWRRWPRWLLISSREFSHEWQNKSRPGSPYKSLLSASVVFYNIIIHSSCTVRDFWLFYYYLLLLLFFYLIITFLQTGQIYFNLNLAKWLWKICSVEYSLFCNKTKNMQLIKTKQHSHIRCVIVLFLTLLVWFFLATKVIWK